MRVDLLDAIENSDPVRALEIFEEELARNGDPWKIHLDLFPSVQRVLNPPFINPHLPKMYRIYREFVPYLGREDVPALVRVEINEYAQRPKLEKLPKGRIPGTAVSFEEIEAAIGEHDWHKTAILMAAFRAREGGPEFAGRLLLLGSGYLDSSLGHSISCTAFILLEMLERDDQDPWSVLATLADYFCKGRFQTTPDLHRGPAPTSGEALYHHLLRAVSGRGIVNLHHTITLYAIERVRHFFDETQYNHLTGSWIEFMGEKLTEQVKLRGQGKEPPTDYIEFHEKFSRLEPMPIVEWAGEMIESQEGRQMLGRFLIKGVCNLYQGQYNPHNLTGLGSALWVMENWSDRKEVALGALFQYLDYFFQEIRSDS
ncbi:MAG: hypothetical protein ABFR82_17130 [Nitrospirota bacterium]